MKKKEYFRDKRSPVPKSSTVSKVMSANKRKDTLPEVLFRKVLWSLNLRGYRLQLKNIPGRPDIAFVKKRLAIFINGCFWHRCPHCALPTPKTNTFFWIQKFEKNVKRDHKKQEDLKAMEWTVITIWECELKKDPLKWGLKVKEILNSITTELY